MALSPVERFQAEMAAQLRRLYPPESVREEWRTIENIRGLYSPRLDIAVGPFSIVRHGTCTTEHNELMDQSRALIARLLAAHGENVTEYWPTDPQLDLPPHIATFEELKGFNSNARCFLAIEIENAVTRKHLLGGALNASALGRVGIAVGWTATKLKAIVRLRAYWDFLKSVGKNSFSTDNLLILNPDQLDTALSRE